MFNKKSVFSYIAILPVAVLLLCGVLTSCKKETTDTNAGSNVKLIINNLSPDVYPVRLYINNVVQNPINTTTTLAVAQTYAVYKYNQPSSYFALKETGYPLQIRSTRTIDSVLLNVGDTLKSNTSYSLFVTGFLSEGPIKYIFTKDYTTGDVAALPSNGNGKLRYVNATLKTAAAYDVYANGTKVFSNVAYQNISPYVELPAGTYNMKFVSTGTNVDISTNVLINLPNITVQSGHLYTLYSYGVVGRTDSAAVGASIITNQ